MRYRSILLRRLFAAGLLLTATACRSKSGSLADWWMPRPRLQHVGKVWTFDDSVQWRSKRDSILRAVTKLGGHSVVCDAPPAMRRFANALYWERNGYYLKITAEKMTPVRYSRRPWLVSLEGYSQVPFECRNPPD